MTQKPRPSSWTCASTSRAFYRARYFLDSTVLSRPVHGIELQRREPFLLFFARWHHVHTEFFDTNPTAPAPSYGRVQALAKRWEALPPHERFL